MPRGTRGRPENERPGRDAVDDALAWLTPLLNDSAKRIFLWVHLFEPHAPYGQPGSGRSVADRYDDEIAESDRQIGRILTALGTGGDVGGHRGGLGSRRSLRRTRRGEPQSLRLRHDAASAARHCRSGRGRSGRAERETVNAPVSLVDVAPTVLRLLQPRAVRQRRRRSLADVRWRRSGGARSLRRVVRPAARLRMEPAAHAAIAGIQVHRRAARRVVRHDARPGGNAGSRGHRRAALGRAARPCRPILERDARQPIA